ncbi:hypothetical protein Pla8534_04330 [Lignipirellula cremea]|uniref:Cytochrome c domain-containing protein n=2 Tax=Lignipirellula cremea TaxID=2528010 RepID=A0A518DLI4_9BACT|nr:hypothetical protein Pla8534_04330 [Lignipirellula cremea]
MLGVLSVLATAELARAEDAGNQPAIGPFVRQFCADCHSQDSPKGDLSLAGASQFRDRETAIWSRVREKIQLGEMPPADADQPSLADRQAIVDWLGSELRRSGAVVEDKLDLPNYGNYTDHAALFDQPATLAPATKTRLWRLRPSAYKVPGVQPFSLTPGQQVRDYSVLYAVDESSAEIVLRNAQQFVDGQTTVELQAGKIVPASNRTEKAFLPLLDPAAPPSADQLAEAIRFQFQKILQRAPTDDELQRTQKLMDLVARDVNYLAGLRAALTVPLLKPEAVYRLELGAGPLDEHGRRRLTQQEIAMAISYALTEDRPHRYNLFPLEQAAAAGNLATREQTAEAVRQLLELPLDKTPRVLGFFDEYFDYEKAEGVFKEKSSFAGNLVADTRALIRHLVEQDQNVLKELLTTRLAVIRREDLAAIYGLSPDYKKRDGDLVELPAEMRAGILTQPSWLIAWSGNFDNDPVRRGKWIRERLLGGTVSDLPISVDAVVPEDPHQTLRQRYEVTQAAYCWKCHQQMNPLGMPFEAYDHMGRFRTKELEQPVDTHGAVTNTRLPQLDGEVSGPIDLMHRLAASERVQQVFVRHAFRYFLGRNETLRDAQTLQEASRAYSQSGGSMKALVVSLLSSDSFLYRINPEIDALSSPPRRRTDAGQSSFTP